MDNRTGEFLQFILIMIGVIGLAFGIALYLNTSFETVNLLKAQNDFLIRSECAWENAEASPEEVASMSTTYHPLEKVVECK